MMYVFSEGRLTRQQRFALAERDAMIDRDGWICWRCGKYLGGCHGGRAHRIARTEPNLARFGPYVLDHRENIRHSCEECNSYAMHFDSLAEREAMLETIRADLLARGLPVTGEDHKRRRLLAKKARLAQERAVRGTDPASVPFSRKWKSEHVAGLKRVRQRLHNYVASMRRKYGFEYAGQMKASEVRALEMRRADLEAVMIAAKKEGDD